MQHAGCDSHTSTPWQRWTPWVLGIVLAVALVEGVSLLDTSPAVTPLLLWSTPLKPVLNALPFLLLAGLLLALSRRLLLSCWLAWLMAALVYGVNALKVKNLATPLMPQDFGMLGQLEAGGHLLEGYLPHTPWLWLTIIAALLITLLLIWREPALLAKRWWARLGMGAIFAVLLTSLMMAVPAWSTVYRSSLGLQPWSAGNTARSTGLVSMLSLFNLRYSSHQPDPDPAKAQQLIAQYKSRIESKLAERTSKALPDIIIVQSESFIDPGILKSYDADAFIPQFTRLQQIGDYGRLHIPTFGGGTIRTEFEVLTGISLRYYPAIQFPYIQFTQSKIPGLVRTLERHGYATTAVHANRPEFWNRSAAFKALGFQHFISMKDFPADVHKDGRYVSDKDMTDEILRQLKDDGPPQFIFAISIEAHGPYDYSPNINTAERDAITIPVDIEGQPRTNLQNFIYHIRHADQQLGRLADVLAKRERPTLLMFYGDHLPALVPAFQADGFDNDEGFFMQTVPWLLVEPNRPEAPKQLHGLAAWTLPGLLLNRAGIHDEPWFQLTEAVAPELAHLTRAPDAPKPEPGNAAKLDKDMANATWLHMRGKLSTLLPAAPDPQSQEGEGPGKTSTVTSSPAGAPEDLD